MQARTCPVVAFKKTRRHSGFFSCIELPAYARGWIPLPSPSHSTMQCTMMHVDRSLEEQVVHG